MCEKTPKRSEPKYCWRVCAVPYRANVTQRTTKMCLRTHRCRSWQVSGGNQYNSVRRMLGFYSHQVPVLGLNIRRIFLTACSPGPFARPGSGEQDRRLRLSTEPLASINRSVTDAVQRRIGTLQAGPVRRALFRYWT